MPILATPDRPRVQTSTHSTDWVIEQTFQVIQESWRILAASREVDRWPRFDEAGPAGTGDESPPRP